VLQPLVVTRSEIAQPDGGLLVEYELIAGERRLRASKLAGLARVPAIIQQGVTDPRLKLELAIIENLQREDLNPVDRALSFARLAQEFSLKHVEIAKKVGKSREYVSNSMRLLALPKDILDALAQGRITEGHARPLMMLSDRAEEQSTLFKEIMFKKLTVREAEQIARHIAHDKIRKKLPPDPELERIEKELAETLGTKVSIERRQMGGKVSIDFFSPADLHALLEKMHIHASLEEARALRRDLKGESEQLQTLHTSTPLSYVVPTLSDTTPHELMVSEVALPMITPTNEEHHDVIPHEHQQQEGSENEMLGVPYDDRPKEEAEQDADDDELYSVTHFSI
jgi:ParB family chromosome partitioning protein